MSFRHHTLDAFYSMRDATDEQLLHAVEAIRQEHEWNTASIEARAARGEALAFIVAERLQRLLNKLDEDQLDYQLEGKNEDH